MNATQRRSGRPSTPVLTREGIMRTALRLLDERGEQGAGIRDIARELGVRPSALYNHVRGQDDIIGGVRELVSDRIDVSGFGVLPWDEAIRRWAESYRLAFAAHPPTIALLAVRPLEPNSLTNHMYDAVCRGLIEAGWPLERVLSLVVHLESFVLGSALDEAAPDDMLNPGEGEGLDHFRAAYNARAASLRERGVSAAESAFTSGLDAMLAGLREEYARQTGGAIHQHQQSPPSPGTEPSGK